MAHLLLKLCSIITFILLFCLVPLSLHCMSSGTQSTNTQETFLDALKSGSEEKIIPLLDSGALLNDVGAAGLRPICFAVYYDQPRCLKILLDRNADFTTPFLLDHTPHKMAHILGYNACCELFRSRGSTIEDTETRWHRLHFAALFNDVQTIKDSIKEKETLNHFGYVGETPLHFAASAGSYDAAITLIEGGAHIVTYRSDGRTLLHSAAKGNLPDLIQIGMCKGLDSNQEDSRGNTPLHHAVRSESYEAAAYLLRKNADPNIYADDRLTPLLWAARIGNPQIMRLLIDHNADHTARADGKTILHYAAANDSVECVNLSIEKGIPIEAKDNNDLRPLHIAARLGRKAILSLLLDKGAQIDAQIKSDETALLHSAQGGSIDCLTLLIGRGALLHPDLLMFAVIGNSPECVSWYLDHSYSPNIKHAQGMYPLHEAVSQDSYSCVELLLKNKADITCREEKSDMTPLMYAASRGAEKIFQLLLRNGASINDVTKTKRNLLHFSAKGGSLSCVEQCLAHKINLFALDIDLHRPHHYAALHGHAAILGLLYAHENAYRQEVQGSLAGRFARYLYDKTRKHDQESCNIVTGKGQTLLHCAILGKSSPCVELLLSKNSNIEAADKHGLCPLHYAASQSTVSIVRILLGAGVQIDAPVTSAGGQTGQGPTALHLAALRPSPGINPSQEEFHKEQKESSQIVRLLLDRGADPNVQAKYFNLIPVDVDLHGFSPFGGPENCIKYLNNNFLLDATPLHCAAFSGTSKNILLLIQAGSHTDVLDGSERTPFRLALEESRKEPGKRERIQVIECLLASGADPKCAPRKGMSPVNWIYQNASPLTLQACVRQAYRLFVPPSERLKSSCARILSASSAFTQQGLSIYPQLYILTSLGETSRDLARAILMLLTMPKTSKIRRPKHLSRHDMKVLCMSEESKEALTTYLLSASSFLCKQLHKENISRLAANRNPVLTRKRHSFLKRAFHSGYFRDLIQEGIEESFYYLDQELK